MLVRGTPCWRPGRRFARARDADLAALTCLRAPLERSAGLLVAPCRSIKEDILAAFPGLTAFYKRVSGLKETKGVLDGTLNMPGPFKPYFIA